MNVLERSLPTAVYINKRRTLQKFSDHWSRRLVIPVISMDYFKRSNQCLPSKPK